MALKPCRECKKKVSTEASNCPSCGAPDPTTNEILSKSKSSKKPANNFIKIFATLGLLIAILLILKSVFGVGKIGINKVKKSIVKEKNITKDKKNSNSSIVPIFKFTCEGSIETAFGSKTNPKGSFIDEYEVLVNSKRKIQRMKLSSNNYHTRPGYDEFNFESSSKFIDLSARNQKQDAVFLSRYDGRISLVTGTYSGQTSGTYSNQDFTSNFMGKCFGIDKLANYLN